MKPVRMLVAGMLCLLGACVPPAPRADPQVGYAVQIDMQRAETVDSHLLSADAATQAMFDAASEESCEFERDIIRMADMFWHLGLEPGLLHFGSCENISNPNSCNTRYRFELDYSEWHMVIYSTTPLATEQGVHPLDSIFMPFRREMRFLKREVGSSDTCEETALYLDELDFFVEEVLRIAERAARVKDFNEQLRNNPQECSQHNTTNTCGGVYY